MKENLICLTKMLYLLIVFVVLVILGIDFAVYKLARYFEQSLGNIFTYVLLMVIPITIISPFKFIKDKRKDISIVNYFKYFVYVVVQLCKLVILFASELIATLAYILMPNMFKVKETTNPKTTEISDKNK